jgi:hypothetical protein
MVVGFSHALDESNLTQEQEDCLQFDAQVTNFFVYVLSKKVFDYVCDIKRAHDVWMTLWGTDIPRVH